MLAERLLRSQPRNLLVIEVCEELKARLVEQPVLASQDRPKLFDRVAYQRDYMRQRRAKVKPSP